ncbi:hypothetical protein ACTQ49_03475 [Luteococcus sp. Sow4_B9]|uniref:hypothetical protein n=1 Tax=Luteococcus sp. Sow4_B9 TaxID=3438792 RepID=UPI003F9C178C
MVTNATIFTQRSSPLSVRAGAQTLRPDQFLLVTQEGVELCTRPFFQDPHGRSFEQLIAAGTERATATLRSAARGDLSGFTLGLSGGKDSRAVLALAIAAGLERQLEIYSADPRSAPPGPSREVIARDLPLAATMVDHYALRWQSANETPQRPVTFQESLSLWQDYRGGQSYEFRAPARVGVPSTSPTLSLHGGGGELYRSHYGHLHHDSYPGWAAGNLNTRQGIRTDLERLFTTLVPRAAVQESHYAAAQQAFVNAIDYGLGEDVESTLDRYYAMHRNRSHFGTIQLAAATGNLMVYPLAQPEFFWANQLLERSDQETGRLLFALIEQSAPDLNVLPFEAHPWPTEWLAESRGDVTVWTDAKRERGLISWEDQNQRNRQKPLQVLETGGQPWKTVPEAQATINENMDLLMVHPQTRDVAKLLAPSIAVAQDSSPSSTVTYAARTATIVDALGISESVKVDKRTISLAASVSQDAWQPQPGAYAAVLSKATVGPAHLHVTSTDGRLAIAVDGVEGPAEYAFYIHHENQRVLTRWYEQDATMVHPQEGNLAPGRWRVTAYIRRPDFPWSSRVLTSEDLAV